MPHSLPVPGPSGLWIASGSADYIFYQRETSKVHQDHIILHEIGHIMADHQSQDTGGEVLRHPLPALDAEVVEGALWRSSHDEDREREAELVATIILEWASVLDSVPPPAATEPSVDRLQAALGDRRGWQ
ncbi:hypothetical protein AB0J21_06265 [Streptomyces sp. NPDC049954]|uniref:hypothetical protein n=1 Tax=Streptomyces sp. NPDC049954 TaxID=3155779 RepID=UPI00342919F1